MKIIDGGVTAAEGFQAAGLAADQKGNTKDMALVYSEKPCVAAGTFTTNVVKAAPVKWDQHIVYDAPTAQAIVCNSGVANACTGEEDMVTAKKPQRSQLKAYRFRKILYWWHPLVSSGNSFRWIFWVQA